MCGYRGHGAPERDMCEYVPGKSQGNSPGNSSLDVISKQY